jgi:plastocyanin
MSILGKQISVEAVVATVIVMVVAALLPVLTKSPEREITLIAEDMAFYLEDDPTPNPAIEVRAGETVRLILKNRERGLVHDFAVPALRVATETLHFNEEAHITFDAPSTPGTYEYVCQPHLLMMKGTLRVIP